MFTSSERYDFKDEEVSYIIKTKDDVNEKLALMILEDFVPVLTYVYKSQAFKELEASVHQMIEGFIRRKFKEAESTFKKGVYTLTLNRLFNSIILYSVNVYLDRKILSCYCHTGISYLTLINMESKLFPIVLIFDMYVNIENRIIMYH
jgi:hypothetical protein